MQRWNAHFYLSETGVSVPQRLVSFFSVPAKRSLGPAELVFLEVRVKGQKHILSHRSRCPTNQPKVFHRPCTRCIYSVKPVLPSLPHLSLLFTRFEAAFRGLRHIRSQLSPAAPQICLAAQRATCESYLQASAKLCRTNRLSHDKEIPVSIRLDERANFVEPPSARIPS